MRMAVDVKVNHIFLREFRHTLTYYIEVVGLRIDFFPVIFGLLKER